MRPHDLLFLHQGAAFEACVSCDAGGDRAGWPDADWLERAPLVVRRAVAGPGRVAVGARGLQRNERCAGHVLLTDVARRVTPQDLAREVLAGQGRIAASNLPCLAALLALALDWGPTGGVGFWLASGLPVLRPSSDLDLVMHAPRPLSAEMLADLRALQAGTECRVDIQVDTGFGGFALNEYARGGRVLLKTDRGPLLVADPWAAFDAAREAA